MDIVYLYDSHYDDVKDSNIDLSVRDKFVIELKDILLYTRAKQMNPKLQVKDIIGGMCNLLVLSIHIYCSFLIFCSLIYKQSIKSFHWVLRLLSNYKKI